VQRGRILKKSGMLRWRPSPEQTSITSLIQRLYVRLTLACDDGLVVSLDRRLHNLDGGVARTVDVDSIKSVSATSGSVNDGQQRATCCYFRVVERVEVAGQHNRCRRTRHNHCNDASLIVVEQR